MFKKKYSLFLPVVFIIFITCLMFFKIFLKGHYPIPADLLVSFYFPWYSGGWEGYNPWTTHKELIGADSIRQIYLWKEFAAQEFKKGNLALWNPYTFSGQPLAANLQSSVYYPLNLFYFITDARNAWIILIVIQPLLAGIFAYLAARSFRLSQAASFFATIAFMFSSYLVTWMENGNIINSYLWLPFMVWAINRFFEDFKFRYLAAQTIGFSLSILAGHPQSTIYVLIPTFLFFLYKIFEKKKPLATFGFYLFGLFSSLALSAIQLVPTYYFYRNSPISLPFAKDVFEKAILPYKNLVTFFASDFFGNPATNNFWSQTYGDFTPYFGVVPLIFAIWAMIVLWKNRFVKFATFASIFFVFSAVKGPVTYLIKVLELPLLDSTTPSRFISISIFLLIILAAFGLEDFLKNFDKKKYLTKFFKLISFLTIIYVLLWLFAIFGQAWLKSDVWQVNLAVAKRNLVLPTLMFMAVPLGLLAVQLIRKRFHLKESWLAILLVCGIFGVTLIGGLYYTNKYLPTSPKKFIFPDHLLFDWLRQNAGIDRFYGGGTAHIDFNFPTHYKVYGAEGYDTLRLTRYAQLLASSFSGKVPESYLRSDGVFPAEENGYRKRLFELLGVKYLLDKEDTPKTGADWHYERFANDNVEGFWQEGKFQVYRRNQVLPRVFLTTKYQVIEQDRQIIQKIYDSNFNLETIILEEDPKLQISQRSLPLAYPKILKYEPNEAVFATNLDYNSLLFLSDAYDPDWNVYVDGQKSKLLRAHYALRSVAVPKGAHQVIFKYLPKSFTFGAAISLFSIFGLIITCLYLAKTKKF